MGSLPIGSRTGREWNGWTSRSPTVISTHSMRTGAVARRPDRGVSHSPRARVAVRVIMQHLLLGMNAHINLDLAIAASDVCPGAAIAGLERDFNEINSVLTELETDVEREVCSLSPWIALLDHIDPDAGRVIANFSIDRARACSWQAAQRLALLSGDERETAIAGIDADVELLARLIARPIGVVINLNLVLVRLRETWDARRVITVLSGRMNTRRAAL
jgi:hypothetical protein